MMYAHKSNLAIIKQFYKVNCDFYCETNINVIHVYYIKFLLGPNQILILEQSVYSKIKKKQQQSKIIIKTLEIYLKLWFTCVKSR